MYCPGWSLTRSRLPVNYFLRPGERLHTTAGGVPPVLGVYRKLQGCACSSEAAGPQCSTCGLTRGLGIWPQLGSCDWRDAGTCYWLGLDGNFVAACCEQTVASSVAGVLLLALLVSRFWRLLVDCFGVDGELPWHCRMSALDMRTAFGLQVKRFPSHVLH